MDKYLAMFVVALCFGLMVIGGKAPAMSDKMPVPTLDLPSPSPVAPATPETATVAPADAKPAVGATGGSGPSADCQCVNCQCDPCTCGQTQYQDVTVNETYYVQVCDGQTCRLVPRVRQVVRRVAVGTAARAANVVRAAVQVPQQVRMNVSGGSTGTATSYQVYDSGDSYGSAGGTQYATTTRYYASSQSAGMPVRRVMARWPVRNALCRLFGCN